MTLDRRSFNTALLAAAAAGALPLRSALAQPLRSLKIIAPRGRAAVTTSSPAGPRRFSMRRSSPPGSRS